MLELPSGSWHRSGRQELRKIYENYCPENGHIPFPEATKQLEEAFIRVRKGISFERDIDWIHPSYRDLVIDELTADAGLRTEFLRRASLEGLKLAVSDTGGEKGERRVPFMLSAESWRVLQERCLAIVSEGEQAALLEVLSSAAGRSGAEERPRWVRLIEAVCGAVRDKWNSEKHHLQPRDLAAFSRARSSVGANFALPDIAPTFDRLEVDLRESLVGNPSFDEFNYSALDEMTAFAVEVANSDPDFLAQRDFPDKYEQEMLAVFQLAEDGLVEPDFTDDPEDLRQRASDMSAVAVALERLSSMPGTIGPEASRKSVDLNINASELEERASELEPPEPDYEGSGGGGSGAPLIEFDINRLFAEL